MSTTPSKKTMIWRGNLVAVPGGRDQTRIGMGETLAAVLAEVRAKQATEAGAPEEAVAATPTAEGQRDTEALLHAQEPAEQAPPVAKQTASVIASTRIMPIESLFPAAHAVPAPPNAASQAAAPLDAHATQRESWRAGIVKGFAQARALVQRDVKRSALYGGAALVLLGLALWPAPEDDAPSQPSAVTSSAQTLSPAKAAPQARGEATPTPDSQHALPSTGLERAAVDALASGDLVRAKQLYLQLAERAPRPSPFSEAARILALSAEHEPR